MENLIEYYYDFSSDDFIPNKVKKKEKPIVNQVTIEEVSEDELGTTGVALN